MTTPWQLLNIAPTTDPREIRLAYATRLKHVRPDEDRNAFQALREARDDALQHAASVSQAENTKAKDTRNGMGEEPARSVTAEPHAENLHDTLPTRSPDATRTDDVSSEDLQHDLDTFFEELTLLASPWQEFWDVSKWSALLDRLHSIPVDNQYDVQRAILENIGAEQNLRPARNAMPELRQKRDRILLLLSDTFAWRQNDKLLYDTLPPLAADRILSLIKRAEQSRSAQSLQLEDISSPEEEGIPPTEKLPRLENNKYGIPIISQADRESFFSTHKDHDNIAVFYNESLAQKKWQRNFYSGAVGAPLSWAASHGLWLQAFISLFFFSLGVALFISLDDSDYTSTYIFFAMFGYGLISPPFKARKILIQKAGRSAVLADRMGLVNELQRHDFLVECGRQRHYWLYVWLGPLAIVFTAIMFMLLIAVLI